jgi:hypothetical protein
MPQNKNIQDFLKTYYFEEEKLQLTRVFTLIGILIAIFPSGPLLIIFSYVLHPYLAIFNIFLIIILIILSIRTFLHTFSRFSPVWKSLVVKKNPPLEVRYKSKNKS